MRSANLFILGYNFHPEFGVSAMAWWVVVGMVITSAAGCHPAPHTPTVGTRGRVTSPLALELNPIPERVAAMVQKMSLEELVAQTFLRYPCSTGPCVPEALNGSLNATGVGTVSIRVVTDTSGPGSSALAALRLRNAVQSSLVATSRLKVPASFEEEGLHCGAWGGTIFPGAIGLGATWNEGLVREVGEIIALEARAAGVDTVYAPEVNMFDPRSGRYCEGISEDPTLTSRLGAAMVVGLQGPRIQGPRARGARYSGGTTCAGAACTYLGNSTINVIALAKHYAQYGADGGGLNAAPTDVSNRTLFEVYLKPWRAMASVGLRGLMVAHSTTLDIPNHANRWLINDVMRDAFGFGDGIVLTDDNNIANLVPWGVAANISHAAARAMAATVDVDLQGGVEPTSLGYTHLLQAVAEGTVTRQQIEAAATRVLAAKFATGLFDDPVATDEGRLALLGAPSHVALACRAASEGIVLVTNTHGALPLTDLLPSARTSEAQKVHIDRTSGAIKVAVIGELSACDSSSGGGTSPQPPVSTQHRTDHVADPMPRGVCPARAAMVGPYTLYNGSATTVPTIVEMMRTRLGPSAAITSVRGGGPDETALGNTTAIAAAANAAALSDITVLVLGDSMSTAREGADRDTLDLAGSQLALLAAVASKVKAANVAGKADAASALAFSPKKLIVVLLPGRPSTFGWLNTAIEAEAGVDAVVVAWRPGQCGAAAILDVLTGSVNPSGKLNQAWPRSVGAIGGSASPWLQRRPGGWMGVHDDVTHNPNCDAAGHCFSRYVDQSASPLFPFGHGLSYATYRYQTVTAAISPAVAMLAQSRVAAAECGPEMPVLTIAVDVANIGAVDGTEIVQAYAHDPLGTSLIVRMWKRLVAFARVPLKAAAHTTVTMNVTVDDLATFDDTMHLRVEAGVFWISVGNSSAFDILGANITVTSEAAAAATACLQNAYRL